MDAAKIVKDYSDELVKRWKEEIDTLLVYVRMPFSPSPKSSNS